MTLPEPVTIARLEESRLARTLSAVARTSAPCAGGVLARGRPGAWMNKAVGLGMVGPVRTEAITALIDFYVGAGIEPRIEVSPYADASLLGALASEGFVVRRFVTTLVIDLAGRRGDAPLGGPTPPAPPGVEIRVVDPADAAQVRAFARTGAAGFMPPDATITDEDLEVWTATAHTPGALCVLALADGRPAGAGAVEVAGPYATLFAQSVLPEFRRRGIQRASIERRLTLAASRGAQFATLSSEPAGPSERNAWRAGFQVAFTRAIMVRPGAGLVPVGGH